MLTILFYCFHSGHASWVDTDKRVALISWRTLAEWTEYTAQWVRTKGLSKQVFTIFELLDREVSTHAEFVGTDEAMFLQILTQLEEQGKCALVRDPNGRVKAVKFA